MTKKKYNSEDGVWRTIGGRKVFIRKGQNLSDAMKESGKFKKASDVKRGDYHKLRAEIDYKNQSDKIKDLKFYAGEKMSDWKPEEYRKIKKETSKRMELGFEVDDRKYPQTLRPYTGNVNRLSGKHINSEKYQKTSNDIKNANDKELRDMSRGWATLSGSDTGNKKEQAEIKRLAKQELANRKGINNQEKPQNNTFQDMIREGKMNKEEAYVNDLEIYSLGEYGKGTYVQFQDIKKNKYDDIMKYPNASPREESHTWARVWEDDKNTLNIEDSKYGARKQVIDYLDKKEENNFVKSLSGKYETDNKGRKITQKEYDEFRQAYKDDKISKEDYKNDNYDVLKSSKKGFTPDEEDILDRYSEDYGYEGKDRLENLKGQIDYMRNPGESINKTAQRLVEGGDFLIYNGDVEDYLKERKLKYNEDNLFDVYKKDMADKIEGLYNQATLRDKYKGTYEHLKNTTNMNGTEILELLKKIDKDRN